MTVSVIGMPGYDPVVARVTDLDYGPTLRVGRAVERRIDYQQIAAHPVVNITAHRDQSRLLDDHFRGDLVRPQVKRKSLVTGDGVNVVGDVVVIRKSHRRSRLNRADIGHKTLVLLQDFNRDSIAACR